MIFLRFACILDFLRMRSEPGQRCCCKGCRADSQKTPSRKPLCAWLMILATLGDLGGLGIAADFCLFSFFHDVILFLGVLLPQTATNDLSQLLSVLARSVPVAYSRLGPTMPSILLCDLLGDNDGSCSLSS